MPTVVGLNFVPNGPIHFYTPGPLTLEKGETVVAETATGPQFATVSLNPKEMPPDRVPTALRPVLRLAGPDDYVRMEQNQAVVTRALMVVPQKIEMLALPMKLIDVEALFEGGKIIVYFTADGRIDFRELVRECVQALGVRVQMHQLGARDHAKMLGGIGSCGRELCCSTWMRVFDPISMKMAKEQSLFLNPSKFSGNCGKLKCCLRYEYEFYAEAHDVAPVIGQEIETPQGTGRVVEINAVKGCFYVDVPEVGHVEVKLRLRIAPVGCPRYTSGAFDPAVCAGCDLSDNCNFCH